jgi:hypothetical protein
MSSALTRVAGLLLVLIALPIAFYGLASFLYALIWVSTGPCAPTAPVCRSPGVGGLVVGGVVLTVAVMQFVIGIGVVRKRRREMIAGLVVSIVGVIGTANVALTAFKPLGYDALDGGPEMVPFYNTTSIAIAAGVVPYAMVAVILFLALRHS